MITKPEILVILAGLGTYGLTKNKDAGIIVTGVGLALYLSKYMGAKKVKETKLLSVGSVKQTMVLPSGNTSALKRGRRQGSQEVITL